MKLSVKMKATMYILCTLTLILSVLLTCTAVNNSEALDQHYKNYADVDSYKRINVFDCNNKAIYEGDFSEDETLRLSTFHIVGDKNKGLENSLLTTESLKLTDFDKSKGYRPEKIKINLTIDSNLQKGAYSVLVANGYRGAIVVTDYTTGEIKAMVSTPSVDVHNSDYQEDGAYINKAITAYPPGSVFKPITVAAMLKHNSSAVNFSYNCVAIDHHIRCFGGIPHGLQPLSLALSNSCNCGISVAAKTYLTPDRLNAFVEESGIISGDKVIADYKIDEGSVDAQDDLMWTANGQSKDMITPVGIASFYNAIANQGMIRTLQLFQHSDTPEPVRLMSGYTSEYIATSLTAVTKNYGFNCKTFGKTGTAELDNAASHGWFACCLQEDGVPTYTVVTFLEHGDSSWNAVQVAKEYINNYILSQEAVE